MWIRLPMTWLCPEFSQEEMTDALVAWPSLFASKPLPPPPPPPPSSTTPPPNTFFRAVVVAGRSACLYPPANSQWPTLSARKDHVIWRCGSCLPKRDSFPRTIQFTGFSWGHKIFHRQETGRCSVEQTPLICCRFPVFSSVVWWLFLVLMFSLSLTLTLARAVGVQSRMLTIVHLPNLIHS